MMCVHCLLTWQLTDFFVFLLYVLRVRFSIIIIDKNWTILHGVQKKTPTHVFFHISVDNV